MNFLKYKKGNVGDVLVFGIFFIILVMVVGVIGYSFSVIAPALESVYEDKGNNQSAAMITTSQKNYNSVFDGVIVAMLLGSWMASIISAFFLDTHPVFFVVFMLFFIVTIGAMLLLNNAYYDIVYSTDVLYTEAFPMTAFIMNHFITFLIMMGSSIGVALYAKVRYG